MWSARPETAPRTYVERVVSRGQPGALAISGGSNAAAHGGWEHSVSGIRAGSWYRFAAYYRFWGVPAEVWQVVARLDWRRPDGRRTGQPNYVHVTTREGEWMKCTLDAQAPEGSDQVVLQLYLSNAPLGTVVWDEVSLEEVAAPGARSVTVAAINFRPNGLRSSAENVRRFIEVVETAVKGKTDVILLPEGITVVGTGRNYVDVAEPVPGPATARLAELARARRSYVIAGIYEREGPAVYNTAVLLNRDGDLAGRYRKVYLPREEVEAGLTPGNDYPVFRTDFGTLGVMICYDSYYPEPARGLARRGAEMVLMPIWGGIEALGKARAIENRVFLVTSGYNYPTYIMDPDGEVLAAARRQGDAAVATVDLNRRYVDPHLGDMRGRRIKEFRADVQ